MLNDLSRGWKIALIGLGAVASLLIVVRLTRRDPAVEKKKQVLKKLFPQISDAEAYKLAESITTRFLSRGERLVDEGDQSGHIYIVRSGEFERFKFNQKLNTIDMIGVTIEGQFVGLERLFGENISAYAKVCRSVWYHHLTKVGYCGFQSVGHSGQCIRSVPEYQAQASLVKNARRVSCVPLISSLLIN